MKIQLETSSLVIFESELFRTTTTLVIRDEYLVLVDPNWLPREIDFIHDYVERIKKNKICFLLFTHSDYDHIIGYGKFKSFTTIASGHFATHPDKQDCLQKVLDFDDQYYIERSYDMEYPVIDVVVDSKTSVIKICNDSWRMYQAVGHNRDGIMALDLKSGLLIAGDYLSNIEFPYIYESWSGYLDTLNKIKLLVDSECIELLIPGHGDHTYSVGEMSARLERDFDYLEAIKISLLGDDHMFNVDELLKCYDFPKVMRTFHEANIRLLRKELLFQF